MDWSPDSLYNKAKLFAQRGHDEPVDSALFGFWMSLALELLARAALAHVHPVLLADPQQQDNIHYAFGIIPKSLPKSIQAKTVFARCSVFIYGFTDKMSAHCLIVADRRNSELHSGVAAFESIDNSKWLPPTYEVIEVLLTHMKRDFADFLVDHAGVATKTLERRRDTITTEVHQKIATARKSNPEGSAGETQRSQNVKHPIEALVRASRTRKQGRCPACESFGVISGEVVGRTPTRIDEDPPSITREVRLLPNHFSCPSCKLELTSYQELKEAGLGAIYTLREEEEPLEFFGINPEDHVDVDEIIRQYREDMEPFYSNE